MSDRTFTIREIARVASPRSEAIDDDWGAIVSTITLADDLPAQALAGLDHFSHLDVIFVFDRVDPDAVTTGARVPRGDPRWPAVGLFGQRARNRPNRLGTTTCEIVAVNGRTITVRGLDAIDGTPVVDLKPYFAEFAPRSTVTQAAWSHELMADYF